MRDYYFNTFTITSLCFQKADEEAHRPCGQRHRVLHHHRVDIASQTPIARQLTAIQIDLILRSRLTADVHQQHVR